MFCVRNTLGYNRTCYAKLSTNSLLAMRRLWMTKVRVYWNLHKKMWSVQDTKTNKVIGHKEHITLWNAKFVVRKGGQKRVREQGKKNVHAFAVGRIINDIQQVYDSWETPYTDDYFMYKNIGNILNWNRLCIIHILMIISCTVVMIITNGMKYQKILWVLFTWNL